MIMIILWKFKYLSKDHGFLFWKKQLEDLLPKALESQIYMGEEP